MNYRFQHRDHLQAGGMHRATALQPRSRIPAHLQNRPAEEERSLPSDYYRTLVRHRRLIAICAALGIVAALLSSMGQQPLYRTRTSLNIQSLNSDFMNRRAVAPTEGGGDASTEETIQTQIKLLQSETLLQNTVNQLEREPHPPYLQKGDAISRVSRALHLSKSNPVSYKELVEDTARRVKVKPLGITHLVEVTCDSWNAEFAAMFCNTMTRKYQEADLGMRGQEAQKTSDWLTHQVADLRTKVQESQARLEQATGGNGLVLSQDSTTVGEERLRQLQAELVKAQADRMNREAEQKTANGVEPGTLPSVIDSPTYRALQLQLSELNARVAELVPPLTEENPKVIHLRSQIKEVMSGMAASVSVSAQRRQNEYSAARMRESLLELTYHIQEGKVSDNLEKMSRVALLRKELESEQILYQTLLQRDKEAGFASAMQASTIHVVDAARTPERYYSPQRGTSSVAGMLFGSVLGIGLAFYRDRNSKLFRQPGEAERFLQVQELGVIPSTTLTRGLTSVWPGRPAKLIDVTDADAAQPGTAIAGAKWNDQFSLVAEAYRSATFSLLLSDSGKRTKIYVVSSPSAAEGKTTVTSNIGVALSKAKLNVLLIDGDLRRPTLHKTFGQPNDFGVRNILRGEIDLGATRPSEYCRATAFPKLSIIPSGTGNEDVVEMLHSPRLEETMTRLSRDFDVILIDTPPMLHIADMRIFAGHANGVILVMRAGVTGHEQASAARDMLEHDGVRLVGTILNDFDPSREGRSGYYDSYYQYKEGSKAASA